ncbi:type I polyketide synthase [Mycolicibacterium sp.]|uniref:type I polyketide synthase n=1 Tax=Mycolicibacterium sp. TaxID=2320850 RepID=UPI0028AE7D7E|nr:type I polyketide synthase [Mycolicibacterium sp.]
MKTIFDRISAMTAEQRTALTEQFDKSSRISGAEPIAVIGIGCRFPGGVTGPVAYWEFLDNGTDGVTITPPDRWDAEAFYDPDPMAPGRMPSKWGAYLSDIAGFDADFFGISPREAVAMDPQQRVALEVAWEALENAGLRPDQLGEIRAAVMMGVYYNEYQSAAGGNPATIDAYSATGNAHSVTVGRIAYLLGLRGPAVAVDTACSSSLVSVHLACQSLRMRESDLALAGGVNLSLRPETQLALGKWGMLSPRGKCNSFDTQADGFVRGEGAGIVVLKRLTDAVRDGDRVLAVVRGSAVNQDGRSNGLTAPNAPAQRDVIARALRAADVTASSVDYVETHGTGTPLGDPIEFDALAAAYGRGEVPCALGAVKTNIGHLEAAAGVAGLIKAVLALRHSRIPPNLNFTQWNPAIDPSSTRFFIPTTSTPWPKHDGPRRAGVSSFGMGGTNAHIVLEQGPALESAAPAGPPVTTLVVSGKTAPRVAAAAGVLADWMTGPGRSVPIGAVAETLNHRSRFGIVATVSARSHDEAVEGLRALAAGQPGPGVVACHEASPGPGTVFVYSGQGAQWAGMGRQLLADEPAFAAAIDALEPVFVDKVGFSLRHVLQVGEPLTGIARIQPVLVGIQLALTELWRSYGVEPDAVIGHSMGEVTAAVVAGALTPAEGLDVIATRSKLMSRLSGQGAMALVELDAKGAERLIADYPDVSVAVYASPTQSVIAGPPEKVDELVAKVDARGLLARRVEVDVASHHATIDPILPELRSALAYLEPDGPTIPVISTVETSGSTTMFGADYWAANLRNPVRFSRAVGEAAADHATFIEISPHPLLTHAISESLGARKARVSGTVNRDHPETLTFHTQLAGVRPPATAQPGGRRDLLVDLPPTPWLHTRYWMQTASAGREFSGAHPLLGMHVELPAGGAHVWQSDVGTELHPWLADHKVHGQPVMPGAGFAEIALSAGCEAFGRPARDLRLSRLEVEQMLPLGEQTRLTTQLAPDDDGTARVEIHSRSATGNWTRHAVARICTAGDEAPPQRPESAAPGGTTLPPSDFYTALRRTGAHHGHAFAALTRIVRTPGGWTETEIALPDEATAYPAAVLHPVLLDAALQTLAAAMPAELLAESSEVTYLPVAMESIRVFGETGRRARCRAELVSIAGAEGGAGGDAVGQITLMDETGTPTAQVSGVYLRRIQRRSAPLPLSQKLFGATWEEIPAAADTKAGGAPDGSWLVLTDGTDTGEITAALASPQRRVRTADLSDESAVQAAFADAASDPARPPVGVLVVCGHRPFEAGDAEAAAARARDTVWSITAAVRAITGGWHGKSPRLWLVTRGGLAVNFSEGSDGPAGGEPGDPVTGTLRGVVRTLAYEYPALRTTLVDLDAVDLDAGLDAAALDADAAAVLTTELAATGTDDVVAWRGGRRFVERLSRAAVPEPRAAVSKPSAENTVRADGAYIVTGGLGGIGLTVARWLVDSGAGRVVLNGRSQPSEETQAVLAELGERSEIVVETGDIAEPGVAERLVSAAEQTGRSLRGVVHSAAVLDDELVAGLTRASLDRIWAPKAIGAVRLHQALAAKGEDRELDWWAGFSSMASLLGSPGQLSYGCANAWLDALAQWRRASGLPATSINWGQWADVGLARSLTFSVLDPMSPAEGLEALDTVLGGDATTIGVARLRLDRAAEAFPELRQLGYFTNLAAELDTDDADDDWAGPDSLREMTAAEVDRIVTARLRKRISAVMGFAGESAIEPDQPLTGLGMDSLMAVRMRNTVRADFGVEPPVALILQGASLADLAVDLIRQLGLAEDAGERPNAVRDRAQQRAAARQQAAARRKVRQRP